MLRYAISDRSMFSADEATRTRALFKQVRQLAAGAVDFFQVREKDLTAGEQAELLATLTQARGDRPHPQLLLNASFRQAIALAGEIRADGIHVPGPGLARREADALRNSFVRRGQTDPVLSVSCHCVDDIRRARKAGASLALFGPVFEKRMRGEVIFPEGAGLEALRDACVAADGQLPVLALGGVTDRNAPLCLAAGAAGIAGIRLFAAGVETAADMRK